MVLNQNKENLTMGRPRSVRFDLPEMAEEEHTPTKVSFVPQMPSTAKRIETQNKYKKIADDLHREVNGLDCNLTEHTNAFIVEGQRLAITSNSNESATSVKVGTDCSGIGIPLIALKNMGIPVEHEFDCDNCEKVQLTIQANHKPKILFPDIQGRDVNEVPYVDVYIAGFPCQPFSTMGKQEGFNDSQGRGTIFLDVLK